MLKTGDPIPMGSITPVSLNSTLNTEDRDARVSLVDRNGESGNRNSFHLAGARSRETSPPGTPPLYATIREDEAFLRDQPTTITLPRNAPPLGPFDKSYQPPPSARLHRPTAGILLLLLFYTALTILGWVMTCILSFRPLNAKHGSWSSGVLGSETIRLTVMRKQITETQNWLLATKILRAITAVFTIPVTSAACALAAVVFVQQNGKKSRLNVRRVAMLADRAWLDPLAYGKMVINWQRYGSWFILLAIVINLLGALVYPLQEGLVSSRTIKTGTIAQKIGMLMDFTHLFSESNQDTSGTIVVLTREALKTSSPSTPMAQIWPGAGIYCNYTGDIYAEGLSFCGTVPNLGNAFNIPDLYSVGEYPSDPFFAELPFGFNTGVLQQFLPRINSTSQYDTINSTQWPTGCDQPQAFYARYSNASTGGDYGDCNVWSIEACMPGNMGQTPWKSTRDRQDFSETLYLNATLNHCDNFQNANVAVDQANYYRVTINTTAGYFELPNYMNGGVAGPLLDKDPTNLCGVNCPTQDDSFDGTPIKRRASGGDNSTLVFGDNNSTIALEAVADKGPLLTLAMALFGRGSFLDTVVARPATYAFPDDHKYDALTCMDLLPLGNLVESLNPYSCLSSATINNLDLGGMVQQWIGAFVTTNSTELARVLNAMAYLANENWYSYRGEVADRSWRVSFDAGIDVDVPVIPRTGMIVTSIVMGLFFIGLFGMVAYGLSTPTWTHHLDAFTMLRIGGAMPEKLPLEVAKNHDAIKDLDEMAGWVGEGSGENEFVGQLAVGVNSMVRPNRRYACYRGSEESLNYKERTGLQNGGWRA